MISMTIVEFEKSFLLDVLYGDIPDALIEDTILETTRLTIIHELIFQHDGKFYRVIYTVGATESQDERPWKYADKMIECTEVVPQEIVVTKWVPK